MKFVCLGYHDESTWDALSEGELHHFIDECLAYDDVLRGNNQFIRGEVLQPSRSSATLRYEKGKVVTTDGPYAETKEQIGGFLLLEARDLDHAIELMSKHPGVKGGAFEIRPVADPSDMIRESEERRSNKHK